MITGKNYIGNQVEAEGTSTFRTLNPELNENNPWIFTEATTNEIEKAVTLAAEAFKVYRNYSGKQKAAFLNAIANEILALGDDLLTVFTQESGLARARAEEERGRTIGQIKAFAAIAFVVSLSSVNRLYSSLKVKTAEGSNPTTGIFLAA